MWDDTELWAWLNQVADAYQADKTRLWARVHQCQHELDEAGYRTTSPPENEADNWVLVIDTTNDERGIPANKPQWKPRARWEAYQAAREEVSRLMNGGSRRCPCVAAERS